MESVRKSGYYYKEDGWWASPFNEEPEVAGRAVPKQKVVLHDATLRDGEQTPGVVFTVDEKIEIAERLAEAGVERIEAGMPAVSKADYEAVQQICKRNLGSEVYSFVRAMRRDVDMARDCGVDGVVLEIPIGYPKLEYQFHWTWETVLEKSVDCVQYAKSQGLKVVYFPYDTTRARMEDLENLLTGLVKVASPDSVGVVDTMGCALPDTTAFLVKKVKQWIGDAAVEIHTHNDFGMAVATELAAAAAGASVMHCCVNGLGERTGNAATEELMMAMKILLGMDNGYDLKKLQSLSDFISKCSGVPVSRNKPCVGAANYVRESGIGVDLVVNKPLAMFATDPRYFGKEGSVVLGKKSGKLSVEYSLDKMGLKASNDQVAEILDRVKALGTTKKGLLTEGEFSDIVSCCL